MSGHSFTEPSIPKARKEYMVLDYRKSRPSDGKPQYRFEIKPDISLSSLINYLFKRTNQKFVLTFPDRTPVNKDNFKHVVNGTQLWMLDEFDQELETIVGTSVAFPPHYHTITESGMYEYYDSRGIDSLVISLAELIDNSLNATKANKSLRHIEIRYYDSTGSDSMVIIIDNGHGMDFNGLHDWARFKYSKFERKKRSNPSANDSISSETSESGFLSFSSQDLPLRSPTPSHPSNRIPDPKDRCPRYLDSEINYFGAGGKQAIFNIGNYTTMISKTPKTNDIVEMTLSKDKFDSKAKDDIESVYRDQILSRSKGTDRQISADAPTSELILNQVVKDMEDSYQSFTICCIKNVFEKHKKQFKINEENYWTKGLARIYHYYLHGPKGNTKGSKPILSQELEDINILIQVLAINKSNANIETTLKHSINLKEITDDFETQLVQSAADTFEFEVEHYSLEGVVIEGIIRYYPYLYDHETIPSLNADEDLGETNSVVSARTGANENQFDEVFEPSTSKLKHREVFECFWHGRLIPQDMIDFEWTKYDPKNNNTKGYEDCYNRLSGALFTNHAFHVSQNKQSFMDLNKLLSKKEYLTFYRVDENGNRYRGRTKFESDFINWIKNCNQKYDKQVRYQEYEKDLQKSDFTPSLKSLKSSVDTYSLFHSIYWLDRDWKRNDFIQTKNTRPNSLIGQIQRFLVPKCVRDGSGQFMGSPGLIEISLMPERVYGKVGRNESTKVIKFDKVNTDLVGDEVIKQELDKLYDRLPAEIELSFPKGYEIKGGDDLVAGRPIGDMQVMLKNVRGHRLTSGLIPYGVNGNYRKLSVQVDIFRNEEEEDEQSLEVSYELASFQKEWGYYLQQKEIGITRIGYYRLICGCCLHDKELVHQFANGEEFPRTIIDFAVSAAPPIDFVIYTKQVNTLIGEPFDLVLEFCDEFDNRSKPDSSMKKPELKINKFDVKYESFDNSDEVDEKDEKLMIIRNIVVSGNIRNIKYPILKVSMPSLKVTKEIEISLQKGFPSQIRLNHLGNELELINGEVPELGVLLFDSGGNEVTFDKQYSLFAKVYDSDKNVVVSPEYALVEHMFEKKRSLVFEQEIVVKGSETPFSSRNFFLSFYTKSRPIIELKQKFILKKNSKPSYVKLYFTSDGDIPEAIEIPDGHTREFPANFQLNGVHFKAFDCDDTPIDLNDFKEQTVFVSWYNKPWIIKPDGCLPFIHVHTDSTEKRLLTFSWQQKKKDIDVKYSFELKPFADSAHRIELNTNSHKKEFPIGVTVTESIQVSVLDRYNNLIISPDIMKRLIIKPETQKLKVDDKVLKKTIPRIANDIQNSINQNSTSFVVSNIRLLPNKDLIESDSLIGQTRLEFSIQGFDDIQDSIDVSVVNGPPFSLNWLTQNKCLSITNNKLLQIKAQLCDEFKNPVLNNKLLINLVLGNDFIQKELTAENDDNGVVTYSNHVNIDNKIRRPSRCYIPEELDRDFHQKCRTDCFGFHKINVYTKYKNKMIRSEIYWLHISCDNSNPVRIDYQISGNTTVTTMSRYMPSFNVRLFAEDKSLINNFDSNKIEMHLFIANDDINQPQVIQPIPPHSSVFRYRIDRAPQPNKYRIKFVCYSSPKIERVVEEVINVVPDDPKKFLVKSNPLKKLKAVTNFGQNRQILESQLILDLVDRNEFSIKKNISSEELDKNPMYSGLLTATIKPLNHKNSPYSDDEDILPMPKLEGCDDKQCLYFHIQRGSVKIDENQLCVEEYTRGLNNTQYLLVLSAKLNTRFNYEIEPFLIKILFCDDTEKQQQLNEIQTEISSDQNRVNEINNELEAKKNELKKQDDKYHRIRNREKQLFEELRVLNERNDLTDAQKIRDKINEYQHKFDTLSAQHSERIFRGQEVTDPPNIDGVVGKVANLGFIKNEMYRSISWYLRNYMDTIVVENVDIAKQLIEEHSIDSVLALDIISQPLLENRLPHDNNFRFTPTTVYVRNFIRYIDPELADKIKPLFLSLLSNTLFMKDLDNAIKYRKTLKDIHRFCPTIVTKEAILLENGCIEVVPKDDNFILFQCPPDTEYVNTQKILERLQELVTVFEQRIREYKKLEEMDNEYKQLKTERDPFLQNYTQNIKRKSQQFATISNSSLNILDEDSNHSSSHYSPDSHRRRRRSSSQYRSDSSEPKRSRY